MKTIILVACIALYASYSCFINGMESDSDIGYRLAARDDVNAIVDLINQQAHKDSDRIVIVPERFRVSYIEEAVKSGRLFVATHNKTILGYKKLYCITDQQECDDILNNELRCNKDYLAECKLLSQTDLTAHELLPEEVIKLRSSSITYIYNGADFTHPHYRAKGINSQLTQYAFKSILDTTLKHSLSSTHIALVYGLTRINAGKESNILDGRTQSILRQFIPFTKKVIKRSDCIQPTHLILSRYYAFKPSFDPQATECKPLSDDQSIPGYGYLIACALNPITTKEIDL